MAIALPDLTAWRDALVASRMAGVRIVNDSNGQQVTYSSDAEMARAIASADSMIARAAQPQPVSTIRFHTSKGL